ncbi:hypothetical protein [Luteibacter sp.]|uniref:hypothetical protein n=1 Tax=Luteibacter sp. TaxID=1886636 RepID=UPI003F7E6CD0
MHGRKTVLAFALLMCSNATMATHPVEISVANEDQVASLSPPVEFCDVVKEPKIYSGRHVVFTARVESDGVHGMVLVDPHCEGAMDIDITNAGNATDRLNDVVMSGSPGTLDKTVTARWTGIFQRTKGRPKLMVESIENISVDP